MSEEEQFSSALDDYMERVNRIDPADPYRWIECYAAATEAEKKYPRLGDRDFMVEIATSTYLRALRRRGLINRAIAKYRKQVESVFDNFPHPLLAVETLHMLIECNDDPSDIIDQANCLPEF